MKNEYKKFGYYYEEIMSRINYDLWLEFVEPYLSKGDRVLDLACGTGTFCNLLTLNGYKADGLDLSESIIEIAREKKRINRLDIDFRVCDMTNFKTEYKYDMITCFFDSMNFLTSKKDVKRMLNCVVDSLENHGYFACDIYSKEMLREYENNELHEDHDTFKIDWYTRKVKKNVLKHEITITENGDSPFTETYLEYYYDIMDISHKNLKLIKAVGDFNEDLKDEDERILLVFQKI